MGARTTRAQSGQRAPTGDWIRQDGQIGASQRLQRRAVSTPAWRAHSTVSGIKAMLADAPEASGNGLRGLCRRYWPVGFSTSANEIVPSATTCPSTLASTAPRPTGPRIRSSVNSSRN